MSCYEKEKEKCQVLQEIQKAILSLPEADYLQLRHWFNELDWEKWDQQIEEIQKAENWIS